MTSLKDSMVPGSLEAGTIDGQLMGLLVSANVKGLVFYPKKAWDAAGYKAPKDIAGLDALTDQIKSDGGTPWCMGIESDTATGWPATDWIETLVMKYNGADVYNKWVTHEVQFDSPEVKKADRRVLQAAVHRRQHARWPERDRQHQLRHRRQPDVRQGRPEVLDVQPGLVHHRLLPEGASPATSTPTSACSASRRPPRAATTRSRAAAT